MATSPPRLPTGTTKFFTAAYSSAPTTDPYFAVYGGSGSGVLVHSETAVSSDSGITWGVHYTIPAGSLHALYRYVWVASYGVGPVELPGRFLAIFDGSC